MMRGKKILKEPTLKTLLLNRVGSRRTQHLCLWFRPDLNASPLTEVVAIPSGLLLWEVSRCSVSPPCRGNHVKSVSIHRIVSSYLGHISPWWQYFQSSLTFTDLSVFAAGNKAQFSILTLLLDLTCISFAQWRYSSPSLQSNLVIVSTRTMMLYNIYNTIKTDEILKTRSAITHFMSALWVVFHTYIMNA